MLKSDTAHACTGLAFKHDAMIAITFGPSVMKQKVHIAGRLSTVFVNGSSTSAELEAKAFDIGCVVCVVV